jgi:hypothetical protein
VFKLRKFFIFTLVSLSIVSAQNFATNQTINVKSLSSQNLKIALPPSKNDVNMVTFALTAIAMSKTKWTAIANEQLLDLAKFSPTQIKAMYRKFLETGDLKISNPSSKSSNLDDYVIFKFDLSELKDKDVQARAYIYSKNGASLGQIN